MSRRRERGVENRSGDHESGMSGDHRLPRSAVISKPSVLQTGDSQRPAAIERQSVDANSGIGRTVGSAAIQQSITEAGEALGLRVKVQKAPRLLYFSHKTIGYWGLHSGDELIDRFKETSAYDPALSESGFEATLGKFGYSASHKLIVREIHLPELLKSELTPLCRTMTGHENWVSCSSLSSERGSVVRLEIGRLYNSAAAHRTRAREVLSEWQGWTPDTVTLSPLQAIPRPVQPGGAGQPGGSEV